MMRSPATLLSVLAWISCGGAAPAVAAPPPVVVELQDGAPGAAQQEPQETLQQKIDRVFGELIGIASALPFYNLFELVATDVEVQFGAEGLAPDAIGRLVLPEPVDFGSLVVKSLDGKVTYRRISQVPAGQAPDIRVRAVGDEVIISALQGGRLQPGAKVRVHFAKFNLPFVVVWLVIGALWFTTRMRFPNLRLFGHAIQVTRGKYDDPNDAGEVTHFQALASALSATVGLGNIAGVAIAISLGGPGATFWMIIAGLLGMSLKFTECTLGQRYRIVNEDGSVSGGPMHYLLDGLKKRGAALGVLGVLLSGIFLVFCIGGSLAGGNAFQVNQALGILRTKSILGESPPFFAEYGWVYGVGMAVLVGIVIIGGIKRIAQTAEKIVPFMCGLYVICSLLILFNNAGQIPGAFGKIFGEAFAPEPIYGGFVGVLVMGFRRAAFSNEAGVGSAAIAHSAAKTKYPVREGIVALLEPFIDTVVVCTMTALVIVVTGAYNDPATEIVRNPDTGTEGAALTAMAWGKSFLGEFGQWILLVAVLLFAYSTLISWSYYGERCWVKLFGIRSSIVFKLLFLVFVWLGSIITARNVLEFGDLMILLMAFPNILGLYFLQNEVAKELRDYEALKNAGKFKVFK